MPGMIEGNSEYNETIIKRIHKVCNLHEMLYYDYYFHYVSTGLLQTAQCFKNVLPRQR